MGTSNGMDQEIVDYVLACQKHGLSDFEIKDNLLKVGWEASVVEQSFSFAKAAETRPAQSALPNVTAAIPSVNVLQPAQPSAQAPLAPPLAGLTDQNFVKTNSSTNILKNKMLWLVVALGVILAGGAFGYYNYVASATPTKIWSKFLAQKPNTIYKTIYSLNYSDAAKASSTGFSLSLSGSSAIDISDSANPKSENNLTLGLKAEGASYDFSLKYLLLNKALYFDVSKIDALKQYLHKPDLAWLKLDFAELQQSAQNQSFNNFSKNQGKLKSQLGAIWSKANIITPTDFLAKENIGDVPVFHIKNQIDNQALTAAIFSSIEAINASQSSGTAVTVKDKAALAAVLNKLQIKQFDAWIGQKDYQLYQVQLTMAAPSVDDLKQLSSFNQSNLGAMGAAGRDKQRLDDVNKIFDALKAYNKDNQGYPAADINGAPLLLPKYLIIYPKPPTPADGSCSDYFNHYYYYIPQGLPTMKKGVSVYPSYILRFCLGNQSGSYKAGIAELTPEGINDSVPCPLQNSDNCAAANKVATPDILAEINSLKFGAEIKISLNYSDFGKPLTIQAPAQSTDILELIKNSFGDIVGSLNSYNASSTLTH